MNSTSGAPAAESAGRRAGLRIGTELLHGNGWLLAAATLLALASTAATLGVPLVVKELAASLTTTGTITGPVLLVVALAIGGTVSAAGSGYLLAKMGEGMILRLRTRVMAHTLRLPLRDVRMQGPGNLVARVTSDAVLLRAVVDVGVVQLPVSVLAVAFTLVVMTVLDWVLVLVTIGAFALAGAIIGLVVVRVKASIVDQQTALGELAQRFTASIAALPTIKAYRAERHATETLGRGAAGLTAATLHGARLQSLIGPVMGLGQQIALVSVIIGGGARIGDGALSVPDFAAFLLYLLQLVMPVTIVVTGVSRLQTGLAARSRFEELLALPAEADEPAAVAPAPPAGAPAVEFATVSFAYDSTPVLGDLSFAAPRRGLTALVGPSGAGKSTVLALIERFVPATAGSIRLLGHDVRDWPLSQLRRRVAYVDQTFTLVEGTVRENLLLGRPELAGEEELLAALDSVALRDEVLGLADGLDTVLGRATDLSGGQRQRIALARMLLTDADVVLLDEPTSQLDSINEHRLRDVVDRLARDRAVLVVAHRLSTVQHADHVLVMAAGRLVDAGTHHELMRRCGEYRELVRGQQWLPETAVAFA